MLARIKSLIGMKDAEASCRSTVPTNGKLASPREPTALPYAEPPTAPYPIECLTPRLRRAAVAIVNRTQGPPALAAQSVLWVTSLAAGSRAKVETLGSPSNATASFITVALSGERKSAADEIAKTGIDRVVRACEPSTRPLSRSTDRSLQLLDAARNGRLHRSAQAFS
jgi:hypothetical protein